MSITSLPNNLEKTLPDPNTPWHTSQGLFDRLQFQPGQTEAYTRCEVTSADPEWDFVHAYFDHDRPTNRIISRIFCIHNPASTGQFETRIPTMEKEALNAHFASTWHKEDHLPLREKAFNRWQDAVAPFTPFIVKNHKGREDVYKHVKILPLWHGSTAAKCHSVCQTGFTFFGKHDPADPANTDLGYFGSGIYFTNSARYAADVYSTKEGKLLLSWVSMRKPFPVIGVQDPLEPYPKDMQLLAGKGAYKNYNAHYIPVISTKPADPFWKEYYPCAERQAPACDELVVFQPAQTLARFWVELEVALLKNPSTVGASSQPTIEEFFDYILALLGKTSIKQESSLASVLEQKLAVLATLDQTALLSPENLKFYTFTKKLLDSAGKVNDVVLKQLVPVPISQPKTEAKVAVSKKPPSAPYPQPAAAAVSISKTLSANSSLPSIAFGALKWEQYFGLKVAEPALPSDIEKILSGPCPIFPGKKVAETHFLTLVPEGMTLEKLEALMLSAQQGNKIGFRDKERTVWEQHKKTPSGKTHWVLLTNDVIPESIPKSWKDQQALAANYRSQGYELLSCVDVATSLFLEYVQTGKRFYTETGTRFYTDTPGTYTRCVEQHVFGSSQWPLFIGGFASGGLYVNYDVGAHEIGGVSLARKFF